MNPQKEIDNDINNEINPNLEEISDLSNKNNTKKNYTEREEFKEEINLAGNFKFDLDSNNSNQAQDFIARNRSRKERYIQRSSLLNYSSSSIFSMSVDTHKSGERSKLSIYYTQYRKIWRNFK